MYRCMITNKQSQPGEPLNKTVVATRPKTYMKWVRDEETNRWQEVEAGRGHEIVRELCLSAEGLQLWNSWSEADKTLFLKQAR